MKKILFLICLLLSIKNFAQQETTSNTAPQNTTISTNNTDQLSEWRNTLKYGISSQRLNVVKQIRHQKISNALPLLQDSFSNDNNNSVKEEMIFTFIDMNMDDSNFWNSVFSTNNDLLILQRAAYAVEKMNIPIAESINNKLLEHTNDVEAIQFNSSAVRALGQLKYIEAIPVITEFATNRTNNNDLRGSAVIALGMYQDTNLIPTLQNFLTNTIEPRLIRRYAALAIGKTQDPQAIEILTPIVISEAEEQSLRLNAVEGLGYLPSEQTISLMEELTKSDNTAMRTEAIKSLGRMKSTNSQEILEFKAFEDPEAIVRREAKKALQDLGFDIIELEKIRKDPNYIPNQTNNTDNTDI